jgi:competence ComEA-like helix-hairpin-helix protein
MLKPARWGAFALALLCCLLCLATALGKKKPPAKPLDLNKATAEQLQELPGIGPVTAEAIVRFREKSGPFRRIEDLLAVRGLTRRKLEALRPYVTVSTVAAKPKP